MNSSPAVIVNKGGFLAAVAKGLFGTIMICVLCATALGLYGMHVADKYLGSFTQQLLTSLPEWQKAMPPILADALNDRRAPDYRDFVSIAARFVPDTEEQDEGVVVLTVKNAGTQTVSLLPLRVVVQGKSAEHLCDLSVSAATPWPWDCGSGPLLPGTERELARRVWRVAREPKVSVEVTDLRVWNGPVSTDRQPAAPVAASVVPPLPEGGNSD